MAHHTKDKGDLAVGMVVSDLLINGYTYAPLMSEHLPFDLIAVNPENGDTRRLQIKYSSLKDNAKIPVKLRSSWADRHGTHTKHVDRSMFDAYAVFCQEVNQIYYINTAEIPDSVIAEFTLRVHAPKNNQSVGVNLAKKFIGVDRIFQ